MSLVELSVCMDVCRVEDKLFTSHKGVPPSPRLRRSSASTLLVGVKRADVHGPFVEDDSVFPGTRYYFQRLGTWMTGEEV